MDAWDNFLENAIARDRQRKKDSRELEIWALENSDGIDNELVQDILESEREYREILDNEIKDHRDWLIKRKGA